MTIQQTIDLSQLPYPGVVETLSFEDVFASRRAALIEAFPAAAAALELESDPLTKLLQENAYRELVLRQRINDAARACMIAFARGADLDALVAILGVKRLTIHPDDPAANPPVSAQMETDSDLRRRAVMALEGYPTAGSVGAYQFHAYSAHADVRDVAVTSPAPGLVELVVLSHSGSGAPQHDVLDAVAAAVTADRVRPLTDTVRIVPAKVTPYTVRATLHVEAGPSPEAIRGSALNAVQRYAEDRRSLGAYVALSGIAAALHQPGVRRIEIQSPTSDIEQRHDEVATMEAVSLDVVVGQS